MATTLCYKNPPNLINAKSYQQWKKHEVKLWQLVTELDKKKRDIRDMAEHLNLSVKTRAGYSPWSNVVVERHNPTLTETINKMTETPTFYGRLPSVGQFMLRSDLMYYDSDEDEPHDTENDNDESQENGEGSAYKSITDSYDGGDCHAENIVPGGNMNGSLNGEDIPPNTDDGDSLDLEIQADIDTYEENMECDAES
ncbi:unnamed protein product [Mytilus coruscus]|uniref:Uncharacterized protein n=1 Tax=Mytilus coruscus TaxID=42192 RepID=A0A6J8AST5_MYTCO|nr:unnamed protein product [Mytilus coruscus]